MQEYFPDREYAIKVPIILGTVGLTAIVSVIGWVMVKKASKKKKD